jgi:hypothetical protein
MKSLSKLAAIDTGAHVSGVHGDANTDYAGNPNSMGSKPDIGAYEYQPAGYGRWTF